MFKVTRDGQTAKALIGEEELYDFFDAAGLDEGTQALAVAGVPIVIDSAVMTFEQV